MLWRCEQAGKQDFMTPIIITAQMGKADQLWADALRAAHFPPERNHLKAHITLFHHLPPGHVPEIKARIAALARACPPPTAMLSDVMSLGRGVAYRVDCPELLVMRDELAEGFTGLLTPQDQARPRLHITVQNKVEPPVAKSLYAELAASFQPRPLAITGLSAYYYMGGPWEPIQSWAFSGRRR
jgi:2'-5' RNA ligase superfamily